jgi:hypothetical protein
MSSAKNSPNEHTTTSNGSRRDGSRAVMSATESSTLSSPAEFAFSRAIAAICSA